MKATVLSLVVSLGFLGLSLRAVRRRVLREQAAVLWLAVSLAMVVLSATLPLHLLDHLASFVGIAYAPDLVLLVAVLFLVVLVFHLSLSLARLHERHTALVQEFGILTARSPGDGAGGDGAGGDGAGGHGAEGGPGDGRPAADQP